jgi:hypothetical protein
MHGKQACRLAAGRELSNSGVIGAMKYGKYTRLMEWHEEIS